MRWGYKTVQYPLKKEGLLGNAFLDEAEIEISLNEYGKAGWELVNILETVNGLTAVFKQPFSLGDDFIPDAFETPIPRKVQAVHAEEFPPAVAMKRARRSAVGHMEIKEEPASLPEEAKSLDSQQDRRVAVEQSLDIGSIRIE